MLDTARENCFSTLLSICSEFRIPHNMSQSEHSDVAEVIHSNLVQPFSFNYQVQQGFNHLEQHHEQCKPYNQRQRGIPRGLKDLLRCRQRRSVSCSFSSRWMEPDLASGGGYFKGLQNKRRMSQEQSDRFKDQTPNDTIGSTFAKLTGITGSADKGSESAAQ